MWLNNYQVVRCKTLTESGFWLVRLGYRSHFSASHPHYKSQKQSLYIITQFSTDLLKITSGWFLITFQAFPVLYKIQNLKPEMPQNPVLLNQWLALFTCNFQGKRRWVHRFTEHFPVASLTCISAGNSLVALGTKDGRIHVYEASREFKCLRLAAILAHHTGAIHSILFQGKNMTSFCGHFSNIFGHF